MPEDESLALNVDRFTLVSVTDETHDGKDLSPSQRWERPEMTLRDRVPRLERAVVGMKDGQHLSLRMIKTTSTWRRMVSAAACPNRLSSSSTKRSWLKTTDERETHIFPDLFLDVQCFEEEPSYVVHSDVCIEVVLVGRCGRGRPRS